MPYDEKNSRPDGPHHLILEGREQLSVSGVEEVESFDENQIVMYTTKGTLVVRGENLHIEKLSLDGGDLKVEGDIDALTYEDGPREKGGLFSRLFR
ncbi:MULTISPECIES: sporulation protein YabP [Oscillospiraceae]|jgi:sporulation protein yabP|uniref:Sporulation protein YabP n=1 Tax=Lawsonibacter faecis TaxID=2763052 RepID=A0A8J6JCG5_9FIRM|nr:MULTISPECIES: sporulation protein YabP [Oscillospiraceae]MTQ96977.1 sporulation protein YabP [Pseudoflavonifractor sp. BIOML-A16]MTR06201.1 sporulation protein YabP [Pseudoflavonifractor sp. BIOML-A15]MTR32785.1 sporulation protein YabP [Pseudoflavonifractor sp. BIOML-A14]MTR72893.1 sporulation protein YabP [Pseudoflavonifractor sp. BIOML-A18]MTS63206.1 sporulation protein YabP [Pseudoflavonifractor sp. BIOML-A5]MTS70985.1 sporulation protein YabP [Pseudoflavonifractor sp. BIOML-A8]MTS919